MYMSKLDSRSYNYMYSKRFSLFNIHLVLKGCLNLAIIMENNAHPLEVKVHKVNCFNVLAHDF